jgi:hypothetical protein
LIVVIGLQIEAIHCTAFDSCLVRLGGGRLTRAGSLTYLETDREIADATHQLALAGIRVTRCSGVPAPGDGVRPAVGLDLVPLGAGFQAMDVIELRPIPLSDASAVLMQRRLPWLGSSRAARDACRRLLREEDAVMGWRRMVWCSVASFRTARARVRLRPVVFDRAGVEGRPLRWTYVSAHAIEDWAFA